MPCPRRGQHPPFQLLLVALEAKNLAAVGTLIARSGLMREESRGAHTRTDFPGEQEAWQKVHVVTKRGEDGRMHVRQENAPEPPAELLSIATATLEELEGEARGGFVTHDGSEVVAGGEGVVEALLFVHLAAADEAQLCAKAEVRERDHEELGTTEGFEDGASFAS